jgi:hypothetical protein
MVSYGRFKCDRDYVGCSWSIRYTKNVKETKCIENTFDNGKWISLSDNEWPQDYNFKLDDTLASLDKKAGVPIGTSSRGEKKLYTSALRYIRV